MQDLSWNAGKKFMGNVDQFLKSLVTFDKDNVPLPCVEKVGHSVPCLPRLVLCLVSRRAAMPGRDVGKGYCVRPFLLGAAAYSP